MTTPADGPISKLMEGYAVETDQGMDWVRPLDAIIETAKLAEGDTCPICNRHSKLFFGDPEGEFWCLACQIEKELGLERKEKTNDDHQH